MTATRYKISSPDVTFESFEGEILIINLSNGSYHSLRGSAVQIWPLLIAGQTTSEIAQIWSDQPAAEKEIAAFATQLVEVDLINSRGDAPFDAITPPDSLPEYSPPNIENYTDMQDLLLLDPIHEVDVTGWPKQPENENAGK
tara:strand:- start:194 stop:619 length:426 start_codon:yes stop_codon:yes gene_type:complete